MRAHLKYLSYVLRHKWFVLLAGLRVGAPLWRLLVHDWTKFLPCEWGPYVEKFYGRARVGQRVAGVADNSGFSGVVRKTRPSTSPGKVDCFIEPTDGIQPRPWWAWSYEVERPAVDAAFDRAWLHHQHANPHHWQHWVLREDSGAVKALPMPEHFVREMVADWMGAGRAITGKWEAAEWYTKNAGKMTLHPDTRARVESLLGIGNDVPLRAAA